MSGALVLAVELANGTTEEISVVPRDLVAFERHYHCSFVKIRGEITYEQTLYLAYMAMRRCQKYGGEFEAFIDDVLGVQEPEEEIPSQPPQD